MEQFQRNIPNWMRFVYGFFQVIDHFLTRKIGFKLTRNLRKAYYKRLEKELKKREEGRVLKIDKVDNITLDDLKKNYLIKGIPVVIKGATKDWDIAKWTLEYLKLNYGEDEINVFNYNKEKLFEKYSLRKFIDEIELDKDKYCRFYPFLDIHKEERKSIDVNFFESMIRKNSYLRLFNLFIGNKDSYTPLHLESAENFFLQVKGKKKWHLIPNYYLPIIDPNPVVNNYRVAPIRKSYGCFNSFQPDYDYIYKLYKYVDVLEVEISEGDILFVPSFYWHSVLNTTKSIGLSLHTLPLLSNLWKHKLFSILDIFTINPSLYKSWKRASRAHTDNLMDEVGEL